MFWVFFPPYTHKVPCMHFGVLLPNKKKKTYYTRFLEGSVFPYREGQKHS